MKFFYLFIFSLILGYTLNAQTNNLVVFTENGEEFILFINSVKQNSSPMASVQAKDVAPSCKIRMSFDNKSIPEFNQNFWTESENMEITLVVKQNNKGKYVMRQVSEISRLESANVSNHDSNATYEDPGIAVSNEPVNIQISHPSQTSETVVTTTTVTTEKNPRDMNKHSDKGRDENVSIGLQIGEDGIKINAKDGDEGFNMSITGSESHRKTESKKHSQTISTTTTTTTTTTSGTTIVPAQENKSVICNLRTTEKWRIFAEEEKYSQALEILFDSIESSNCKNKNSIYWHIGQVYAYDNDYQTAIKYLKKSSDIFSLTFDRDWRLYYKGTIAFLKRDKNKLEKIGTKLCAKHSAYYYRNVCVVKSLNENFDDTYKNAYEKAKQYQE